MAASAATRQILVTGPPGVGKTTLIRKVCQDFSKEFPEVRIVGFFTQEIRDSTTKQRTGFEIVKLPESEGKRGTLATVAPPGVAGRKLPSVGKYTVLLDDFERVAMECMREATECPILVLDELGKMESFSGEFCKAVSDWLKTDKRGFLLASIPMAKGKPLRVVEEVQKTEGSVIVTLSRENRDKKCQEVKNMVGICFKK